MKFRFIWLLSAAALQIPFATAPASARGIDEFNLDRAFRYGYTWRECERGDLSGSTLASSPDARECIPDTLYSWQVWESVTAWMQASTPSNVFPAPYLYTWRTPMGSFGYGNTLVRLKLRPDTQMIHIDPNLRNCDTLNSRFGGDRVAIYGAYLPWLRMSEYLVCSSAPVMSWSVNQPESLEEVLREIAWIEMEASRPRQNWDSMLRNPNHHNVPWKTYSVDVSIGVANRGWEIQGLRKNIQNIEDFASRGGIFYSSAAAPLGRAAHFTTRLPSYFNDRPEPGADPHEGKPKIQVTRARYGADVARMIEGAGPPNAPHTDLTAFFKARCNGTSWCKLEPEARFIPDPDPAAAATKAMAIEWRCEGIPGKRFGLVALTDRGAPPTLDCLDPAPLEPRKIRIRSAKLGKIEPTALFEAACGNQSECQVTLDFQALSLKKKAVRSLQVEWSCGDDPEEGPRNFVLSEPKANHGTVAALKCD
jgi:hypothetical protein